MSLERDLPVPSEVIADTNSMEVLRAWVASDNLFCALRPTRWKDASAWGLLFADAARHVANAVRDEAGDDPASTIAKIREMFNRELDESKERAGKSA